ncbi:MAG: acyl-CoA dehydrogenase family protein [Deltaproteobacteria bacterium]|nr:acyl-CoA dehydrogenase family protein [Deltaproteobacteria bacterium]
MAEKNRSADSASPAKSLFLGNILEDTIFPFPKIGEEERETLKMVVESIDKFMSGKEQTYREYDNKGEQPQDYLTSIAELGLFGLIIPEEYGGLGLSNSGYARIIQQTSRYDASTSLTIGAHSSIGMKALLLFGTEAQKAKYLPKLSSGEMIAAFCLTEPGSGSDAASIKTNAIKNSDGSWTLNGEKIWITNGGTAGFYTVFARTGSDHGKLTAFIVERSWTGVSNGPKEDKMGIRASCTTSVAFSNVKVPAECVLGGEGNGFKVAMSVLNNGRTGLGGGCIGGMKRCIALAARQAKERKQFGKSIAEFGLIKEKIARMTVNCFSAEAVVAMVGHLIDSGHEDYSVEAAISKVYATECLWNTAHEALQIAGGNGFMKEFPYEMIVRDSRINMIFEGTNEILRLYIALSGMKDAGEHLKDVAKKIGGIFNDPIKGFGVLSQYATKRLTQLTPLGRDKIESVDQSLRPDAIVYEQYTTELAKAVEVILRRHGKNVVEKQFAMKRIADVVIDLFVGLCLLSRVNSLLKERGAEKCKFELSMLRIYTQAAKRRVNQTLRRVDINEDEEMKALSDFIVEGGGFPWDTI